jgi:glycosyltransferase involved in cell wall biosynthesis
MLGCVSVVIPVFNRASIVGGAIESCLAQANETFGVEVIAVDDGSTDSTPTLLAGYRDRIRALSLSQNSGRNVARNTGLAMALGDWVKFLDSDDVLEPGSLEAEVTLAVRERADVVIANTLVVDAGANHSIIGRVLERLPAPPMDPRIESILLGHAVPTSAALYRTEHVRDLRWDTALSKLDDWDWFVRVALRGGRIVAADHVSYRWIQHPGQGIRSYSMLQNAREHHVILGKIESHLTSSGELTDWRRRRLAQYYYKELRVLCLHDSKAFEAAARHISELDPWFQPRDEERQRWMRWLARLLGFRRATLLHTGLKRTVRTVLPRGGSSVVR